MPLGYFEAQGGKVGARPREPPLDAVVGFLLHQSKNLI
jgi:hypothetical protein